MNPPCPLKCPSYHLVVVQVFTSFNRRRGGFIGFIDIVVLVGHQQLIHLLFRRHLSPLLVIISDPLLWLNSGGVSVLEIVDYRHCHQLFLYWRLKILIWVQLSVNMFVCSFKKKNIWRNISELFPYYHRLYMCASLPWFHVVFFHNLMFSPCILVWPLIIINDFVWSVFIRNLTVLSIFSSPFSVIIFFWFIKNKRTSHYWSLFRIAHRYFS